MLYFAVRTVGDCFICDDLGTNKYELVASSTVDDLSHKVYEAVKYTTDVMRRAKPWCRAVEGSVVEDVDKLVYTLRPLATFGRPDPLLVFVAVGDAAILCRGERDIDDESAGVAQVGNASDWPCGAAMEGFGEACEEDNGVGLDFGDRLVERLPTLLSSHGWDEAYGVESPQSTCDNFHLGNVANEIEQLSVL